MARRRRRSGRSSRVRGRRGSAALGRLEVAAVARPESSSPSSISGANWSVSKTVSLSWRIAAMRLSPRPVSMFWAGQRRQRVRWVLVVLHEHEVPVLQEAPFSPPGRSSRLPTVERRGRDRARSRARRGRVGPDCQKFSERGHSTIRSRGTPTSSQRSIASWSGPIPSSSSPPKTVAQMSSSSRPKPSATRSQA